VFNASYDILINIQTCKKSSCLKELGPGDGYQTCNNELPCKNYQRSKKGNILEGESKVIKPNKI
jgi:hypothetical protein